MQKLLNRISRQQKGDKQQVDPGKDRAAEGDASSPDAKKDKDESKKNETKKKRKSTLDEKIDESLDAVSNDNDQSVVAIVIGRGS